MSDNVKVQRGDIFQSKAQTLVNTVNCVGVMGKGLALEFRKRFPDMYEDYVERCNRKQVKLGEPYLLRRPEPPWILNFPTKDHWRSVSRLEDIVRGLEYLEKHYEEWGITSLAVPALGCQQGQLEWRVVGPTLHRYLSRLNIPVELYAPLGAAPEEQQTLDLRSADVSAADGHPVAERINSAWVALAEILDRIEREPYHWTIGSIAFQKIAYFATELGLPTGLQHRRASYGPFAESLKGIKTRLVNNGLVREERIGEKFAVKTGSTFQDARQRYQRQLEQWEPIIEKVADLMMRMRTTRQAEVAATVHFVAKELTQRKQAKPTEVEVLEGVMDWKLKRRPPLNETEVAGVIRNMAALGWLDVEPSDDLPLPQEVLLDF